MGPHGYVPRGVTATMKPQRLLRRLQTNEVYTGRTLFRVDVYGTGAQLDALEAEIVEGQKLRQRGSAVVLPYSLWMRLDAIAKSFVRVRYPGVLRLEILLKMFPTEPSRGLPIRFLTRVLRSLTHRLVAQDNPRLRVKYVWVPAKGRESKFEMHPTGVLDRLGRRR